MIKGLRIVWIFLMVVVLTTSTLAAPEKVALRFAWWGNPTRDAATIKVIKMYMAMHPNVTIETEATGWVGYWDKLAAQAAAGTMPDIIQMDYAYIAQFASKNVLLELSPYRRSRLLDLSSVSDSLLSGGRFKNKLFGIACGINALGFIYDPAILQKAGVARPSPNWTWGDFEKMVLTVYKKTGIKTPALAGTDPRVVVDHMVRQKGQSFFNAKDGSSLGFKDPKVLIDFFELQVRLLKAGAMISPDKAFATNTPQESGLAKGEEWVGTGFWSNQIVMQQAAMNRPIAITLVPRLADGKRSGTYLKPAMFLSVARQTKQKDEAVKFINYFLSDFEANKILMAERGIPIIPTVRETLKALVSPVNKQVFEFIELVNDKNCSPIDPADPPGAGEVLKTLRTIDQEVLYGVTPPKEAAAKFIREANKILVKNKVK